MKRVDSYQPGIIRIFLIGTLLQLSFGSVILNEKIDYLDGQGLCSIKKRCMNI